MPFACRMRRRTKRYPCQMRPEREEDTSSPLPCFNHCRGYQNDSADRQQPVTLLSPPARAKLYLRASDRNSKREHLSRCFNPSSAPMDREDSSRTPSGCSQSSTENTSQTGQSQAANVPAPGSTSNPVNLKRRRGLGVVTPNACRECRKKRTKVFPCQLPFPPASKG